MTATSALALTGLAAAHPSGNSKGSNSIKGGSSGSKGRSIGGGKGRKGDGMSDEPDDGDDGMNVCMYRTIEVGANETRFIDVESGETFSNARIDITADGTAVNIDASGSDWTIHNVGIDGIQDADEQVFNLQVDAGGTGLVENVYFGDGATNGGAVGAFVPTDHAGTLTFRRVNVGGFGNNGIYGSAPGREPTLDNPAVGQGGVVRIEASYAQNNNIAGFRIGTDGSYIRNSVVHVDEQVLANRAGQRNARGVWAKEGGDIDIDDSDILLEDESASYGVWVSQDSRAVLSASAVAARDGARERFVEKDNGEIVGEERTGNDPNVTPPDGVPLSAQEAACGN